MLPLWLKRGSRFTPMAKTKAKTCPACRRKQSHDGLCEACQKLQAWLRPAPKKPEDKKPDKE
jgi:hypothetical protein